MTTTSRVGFCEIGKLHYNFFALLFEYDAHFALLLLIAAPGRRVHGVWGRG